MADRDVEIVEHGDGSLEVVVKGDLVVRLNKYTEDHGLDPEAVFLMALEAYIEAQR